MPDSGHSLFGTLRLPPHNPDAERSLLGGIMHNAATMRDVMEFLRPEHFYEPTNGRIFAEQRRRIVDGNPADAVSLKCWFDADPSSAVMGGDRYLVSLITSYVGPGTAVPYAREIREAWERRQMIEAAEDAFNMAFERTMSIQEIAAVASSRIETAIGAPDADRPAMSLDEAMDAAIAAAEEASRRQGPAGLSTGFASVDERLGGLEEGTLTVIAGRPGMGKSALVGQMAVAAARKGTGVIEISLEMSARELGRRALAALSGVPVWVMKRGVQTVDQTDRLVRARKELSGLPMTIIDGGGLTPAMISMKCQGARRKHGIGLIVVDHLHIVRPEDADIKNGATWAIGRISGAMKRMAKEQRCPVVLAAQLNRAVEGRDDKRPALSDLRQAGDIEQDADAVGFVYRPEYYMVGEPERRPSESEEKFNSRQVDWNDRLAASRGIAELVWAKVRDGEAGIDSLRFDGPTTTFSEEARGNV